MKRTNPIAFLAGWLALGFGAGGAPAAEPGPNSAATGGIEGRVFNTSTGSVLKNARVRIDAGGTSTEVFTDDEGRFRAARLPGGTVSVNASYTGFEAETKSVHVQPGSMARQDFNLPLQSRTGTVMMDAMTIEARELTSQMAALHEQRNAPNIKHVISNEDFEDIGDGNIGNFLKFVPGLDAEYEARGISIRGFPEGGTLTFVDGAEIANNTGTGDGRQVDFDAIKMNTIDRIEVTKVPTPDMPANAQGGMINVFSKSGFNLKKPVFTYRLYATLNDNAKGHSSPLQKVYLPYPESSDYRRMTPARPAFNLSYVAPLGESLAVTVGLASSTSYINRIWSTQTWDLQQLLLTAHGAQAIEEIVRRRNGSIGLDWKLSANDTIKINYLYTDRLFWRMNTIHTTNFGAGATGNLDFTQGAATGVGSATRSYANLKWDEITNHLAMSYRHQGKVWKIDGNAAYSTADSEWRDLPDGFVQTAGLSIANLVIRGEGIGSRGDLFPGPARISAFSRTGQPVDIMDGGLYTLASVNSFPRDYVSIKKSARLDFRRDFSANFQSALQAGAAWTDQSRDYKRPNVTYTFRPGTTAAERQVALYDLLDPRYSDGATEFFPGQTIQHISAVKLYGLMESNPSWFVQNDAANYTNVVQNSKLFGEAISAGYVRGDARFLRNRLWIVGGVRYERTDVEGEGPLNDIAATYRRDANGNFIRDNAGRLIPVTTNALATAQLRYTERASRGERNYDGFYPSLNASFDLTDKIVVRAAYARTIGRPAITNVVPGIVIADPDAAETNRTISVVNTGLLPWISDGYDLSAETYIGATGMVSLGVFRKDVKNFFGGTRSDATPELLREYGLSDEFLDYDVLSQENVGKANISGVEMSYRQALAFLPHWARGVHVNVNGTLLDLKGPDSANFGNYSPGNLNWGISLARPKFLVRLNSTNSKERRDARIAPSATVPEDTYQYRPARTALFLNFEYRLHKHLSIYGTVSNITRSNQGDVHRYAPGTPDVAKAFRTHNMGTDYILGVKGTF